MKPMSRGLAVKVVLMAALQVCSFPTQIDLKSSSPRDGIHHLIHLLVICPNSIRSSWDRLQNSGGMHQSHSHV